MQKTTKAAMLAAALWMGISLAEGEGALAQDPEQGAVELDGPEANANATGASTPAPAEGAGFQGDPSEQHEVKEEPRTGRGNLSVFLGPRIGVGGGFRTKGTDVVQMARVTPGMQLGVDYVLWRYFALGAESRLDWAALTDQNGGSKIFFWSLMAKPRVRYQLKSQPMEVYLAVPGGLSVSNPAASNLKGKPSGMVGIYAGASYFFGDHWALNAELGWTWQWLRIDAKVPGMGPPSPITGQPASITEERKARFAQLTLLALNVSYAF